MQYFISNEQTNIPDGFRTLTDEEIARDFKKLDLDKSYFISKNEWMLAFIKILGNDIALLEQEGPDSIMGKIQELSDQFDKYDINGDKFIDYLESKNFISENILISE